MYSLKVHYFTVDGMHVSSITDKFVPGTTQSAVREFVRGLTPSNPFRLKIAFCYVEAEGAAPFLIKM